MTAMRIGDLFLISRNQFKTICQESVQGDWSGSSVTKHDDSTEKCTVYN